MPQIYTNPVRCGIIYKEIKRGECRAKTDAAKVKIVEIMDEIPESIGTRTKPQQFDMASYFKSRSRQEFFDDGFRCSGRVYYRIIGDVFQSFRLHKAGAGTRCMIEFAVLPLCEGAAVRKTSSGSDRIKAFGDVHSWFEYEKTKNSIIRCGELMIAFINTYLMPFFNGSDTAEKAYDSVVKFQKEHRKEGLDMADPHLYYMAIKSKKYDAALSHLLARKEFVSSGRRDETGLLSDEEEIDFAVRKLEKKDYKYFEDLVYENEKIARFNITGKTV